MSRRVSSKVIKTDPFIERRRKSRNTSKSNNRHRRVGDIPAANIRAGQAVNLATRSRPSATAKAFRDSHAKSRFFDCYA